MKGERAVKHIKGPASGARALGMGWLPSLILCVATAVATERASAQTPLPARVINHEHLPVVGTQRRDQLGPRGQTEYNCAQFNRSYYCMTHTKAREHGWLHPDPATHPERVISPDWPEVVSWHDWHIHGCATYADLASGFGPSGMPTRPQWEAALRNRIWGWEGFESNSPEKLTAIKTALSEGRVGVCSLMATPSFDQYGNATEPLAGVSEDVFYSYAGQNGIGHVVTMIGYDDEKTWEDAGGQPRQGAFLAVNSWGTNWGILQPDVGTRGFIWLAYDFVSGANIGAVFPINRLEEIPRALAVIAWNHPLSHQVVMELRAGRALAPSWSVTCGIGKVDWPIDVEIVLDITEPYDLGARAFWLRTQAADLINLGEPAYGTVTKFALELPDTTEPWNCPNVPATTIPLGSMSAPQYLWLAAGLVEDEGSIHPELSLPFAQQVWGDFAGDGRLSGVFHTHRLRPDSDGSLKVGPSGLPDEDLTLASGDLNNDGRLDLLSYSDDTGRLQAWTLMLYSDRFVELPLTLPSVDLSYGQIALVDFNNDGWLDIATYPAGGTKSDPIAFRLWLRQSDGTYADSGIRPELNQIPGFPVMGWDDFDGDGWIDVALTATVSSQSRVALLRNTGGSNLEPYVLLEGYRDGAFYYYDVPGAPIVFGDANNDGRPDLAMGQRNVVYFNRGDGVFERVKFGPTYNLSMSTIDWVDIDNDGFLDLITSGDNAVYSDFFMSVWRNNGDETFSEAVGTLAGMAKGSTVAPVDLDDDGDVDFVAIGTVETIGGLQERGRSMRIFRNHTAQTQGYSRPNLPPSPPTNLQAALDANRNLTLNWTAPVDDRTHPNALRYHLRLDTFPGWNDLNSSAFGNGFLTNRMMGRLGAATGALATHLPARPFYCSVQAVDGTGAHSAWSKPLLIPFGGQADSFDVNRDGTLDASDIIACRRLQAGLSGGAGWQGDVNADGTLTDIDTVFVISQCLKIDLPGPDVLTSQIVGPLGGRLQAEGFDLQIAEQQLDSPRRLTLQRFANDRPAGDNSVSPTYRVAGLPPTGLRVFTLKLQPDRPFAEPPLLVYGQNGWGTSGVGDTLVESHFAHTDSTNNWYTYPVRVDGDKTTADSPRIPARAASAATAATTPYEWGFVDGWFGMASGKATVSSERFFVVFPASHDLIAVAQLLDRLEEAYSRFINELLFAFVGMPRTKIQVEVKDRGINEYGSFLNLPGTGFDKLEFNTKDIVRDNDTVTATAYHEFSHCAHSQYYNSAWNDVYWLDEATAVWTEAFALPGNTPLVYDSNAGAALNGMIAGSAGNAEKHGYGMASLFKYMQQKQYYYTPNSVTSRTWHRISSHTSVPGAILHVLGETDYKWYTEFLEKLVGAQLFPYNVEDINRDAPPHRTIDLSKTSTDQSTRFKFSIPALGGHLYQTYFNRTGLPDDVVLSHRVIAPDYFDLSGFKYVQPGAIGYLGRGNRQNGVLKADTPIGSWTVDSEGRVRALSLLTNRENNTSKYLTDTDYEMRVALTWDRSYPMPATPAVNANVYGGIPELSVEGTIQSRGLTNVEMIPLVNVDGQGNSAGVFVSALLIGTTPLDLTLDFATVVVKSSATEVSHSTTEYEYVVTAIKEYRLEYYDDEAITNKKTLTSPDGRFTVNIPTNMVNFSCNAMAVYDVDVTTRVDGVVTETRTDTNVTTNLGGGYLIF